MAYGVWRMAYGVWRMAYGVWRMAYGVWRMAYGVWRIWQSAIAREIKDERDSAARKIKNGNMCRITGK